MSSRMFLTVAALLVLSVFVSLHVSAFILSPSRQNAAVSRCRSSSSSSSSSCSSSSGGAGTATVMGHSSRTSLAKLFMAIEEFGGDVETESEDDLSKKKTTHGYEGDFQVGDVVRVIPSIHIWSVKEHMKEGFNCKGFVGTVGSLQLYGRKFKTLCSAITPVKIDIMPDAEGVPPGLLAKKVSLHFAGDELELISRPPKVEARE